MTQAALPHLQEGGSIINTTSINAYKVRSAAAKA
jgi:NAD(P)-dependent dehydrogenase (short-subunit alcohol dehydrogenase family)